MLGRNSARLRGRGRRFRVAHTFYDKTRVMRNVEKNVSETCNCQGNNLTNPPHILFQFSQIQHFQFLGLF